MSSCCQEAPGLLLGLRVTTDGDPGAIARVLERFQNINVTPRLVRAEWGSNGALHVDVQVIGLAEETMTLIAARLGQVPCVMNAFWYRP